MWKVEGNDLTMSVGDFGLSLPVLIDGVTLSSGQDEIGIKIVNSLGEKVLEKVYSDFTDNEFSFVISESETQGLQVGEYVYGLDWYRNGVFMCNIISRANFRVVKKV